MAFEMQNCALKPNAQGNGGVICYNSSDDALATIDNDGYFNDQRVIDFVDRCGGDTKTVRVEVIGSDGQEVLGLYNDNGTLKIRGAAAYSIT